MASSWVVSRSWHSLACTRIILVSAFIITQPPSLGVYMRPLLLQGHLLLDLGPTLIQYDLVLTYCTCKDPISKFLRFWMDINIWRTLFNHQKEGTMLYTESNMILQINHSSILKSQNTSDALRENFLNVYGRHRINLPNVQKSYFNLLKKKERKENQQYEKQTKDKKFTVEEIKKSMER